MLILQPCLYPPVVVAELERAEISVNESEALFMTCITKNLDTARPVEFVLGDTPVTATNNAGEVYTM